MERKQRSFFKHNLPGILWALMIMALCFMPSSSLPDAPFMSFDKLVHAGLFLVLTILLIRGFKIQDTQVILRKHPIIFSVLIAILYGALVEVGQGYFRRTPELDDAIANTIGSVLALIVYRLFRKHRFFQVS